MKLFSTWVFNKKCFLAVEMGGKDYVMDENGLFYGSWMHLQTFKKRQKECDVMADPIGQAMLNCCPFKK
jgi:hypothetical protein